MKTALSLLAVLLFAACASTDDDAPPPMRDGGRRMPPMRMQADGALDLLPPPNWWHDPQISSAVKLSESQFAQLDTIGENHDTDIDRLRMDATAGERDLRLIMTAEHPTETDILTAGQRVRTTRDQLLDQQLRMLAEERALLTLDQWNALKTAMRDDRQDDFRRRDGGYGRGGGMGGRRGGGRRGF